jgi:hypothetical protein
MFKNKMTNINPIFIFELLKQKVDWNTFLTPVRRINDFLETFNALNNKTLLLNGKNIPTSIPDCKTNVDPKDIFKTLDLTPQTKTVVVNFDDLCLLKNGGQTQIRVGLDLYGFEKKLSDLISSNSSEEALLNQLKTATTNVKKYATIPLGNVTPSPEKKDILGLLLALVNKEYKQAGSTDGDLKQEIQNEIGLSYSQKQKFVEILDATKVVVDEKLCDAKDSETTNSMVMTNITEYRMLDGGKSFCIDLNQTKFYQQQRVLTINTTDNVKSNSVVQLPIENGKNGKGMMDSGKKTVLESYVAGFLNQVYADKKKWNVEWIRMNDNIILLKVTNNDTKEIIFNKIDITNAISVSEDCPKATSDPVVREYVSIEKFCKGTNQYKVQINIVGSEYTSFVGTTIPFSKLEEVKSMRDFENFRSKMSESLNKPASQTLNDVEPKQAFYYRYGSPYGGYGAYGYGYGGLFGLGTYGAGIYGYPRGGVGLGYGLGYGLGVTYVPPVATAIVPTAPVVGGIVASPYTYPAITTSTYTLGSYYAPYNYAYASPYAYSPYGYGYGSVIIKSDITPDIHRIKANTDRNFFEFRLPERVSGPQELKSFFQQNYPDGLKIEKISNHLYKIQFDKYFMKEIHYYNSKDGELYHSSNVEISMK